MTCSECRECGKPIADCSCQECNPCKEKERECCVPNIVPDWDCIKVEIDSEWVIHLSTRCNPQIVSRNGSVDVTLDDSWDVDVWNLEVDDSDRLVAACWNDLHPSTLDEKIVWISPITVTPVCSNNGRIEIWLDKSKLSFDDKKVAVSNWCNWWYLSDVLKVSSKYVRAVQNWCEMVITDNDDGKLYYAKLVLAYDHILWNLECRKKPYWEEFLWQLNNDIQWRPVRQWSTEISAPTSLLNWLEFENWTPSDPWLWQIKITKKGLYQVWFTWSAEFSYWIHAFRVQMYRAPAKDRKKRHTITESRYSGPLWYQPWQDVAWWFWNVWTTYVSNVSITEEGTVRNVTKSTYNKKFDFPLLSDMTEVEWLYHQPVYSQSLWIVMDRVTVTWNTIVELDVGDLVYIWLKISTDLDHTWWDYLDDVPWRFKQWHFALLWMYDTDSDNGWEAWFSFYANLIHPL